MNDSSSNHQISNAHLSSFAEKEEGFSRKILKTTTFWIFLVVLLMVLIFGLMTPNHVFLKLNTLLTIGLNATLIMILAVGMTFILGAGEIDLSIGANILLSSTLAARALKAVMNQTPSMVNGNETNLLGGILVGIFVALGCGSFFGCLNGLVITKLKVNSFITTLATQLVFWGTSLVISNGSAEVGIPRALQTGFGHRKLFDLIPLPLILALFIGLVLWFVMSKTKFGLYTCAIGSSGEASRRAGINVEKHKIQIYMLMGFLAGIAGVIELTRFATTNPQGHQTDALMAITASVLGGTSMLGGIVSIWGAILGSLIPVILQTGLVVLQVGAFYQYIGTGLLLIGAVFIDNRRRKSNPGHHKKQDREGGKVKNIRHMGLKNLLKTGDKK